MNYLIASFISAIGWGVFPIIDRKILEYINAFTLVGVKGIMTGFVILLYFMFKRSFGSDFKVAYKKKGNLLLLLIFLSGFFAYGVGVLGYTYAIDKQKASLTTIVLISYCVPVVIVTLLSTIIYKDKINLKMIAGILITLIGLSIVVVTNPNKIE